MSSATNARQRAVFNVNNTQTCDGVEARKSYFRLTEASTLLACNHLNTSASVVISHRWHDRCS